VQETEIPLEETGEITLESLAARLDVLGAQMNWLCENLQSLFVFVNQVGQNGGGLRGMLSMLKAAPPELMKQESTNGV